MTESRSGFAEESARLRRLGTKKKFDELEAAWVEAIEKKALPLEEFLSIVQMLAQGKEQERVGTLLWYLLTSVAEANGPSEAIRIVRELGASLPEAALLREELASLYRAAYPDLAEVKRLAEMTLLRPDIPIASAVRKLDKLLSLRPGTYALDTKRMKPGRVVGLSAERNVLEVAFADATWAYDGVSIDLVERLEPDDFRAVLVFEREKLRRVAESDPAELLRLVLRAFGPRLTYRDVKAILSEIVPAESWSKWWTASKPQIARSPMIELSEGPQPVFTLRRQALAYEDSLRAKFDGAAAAEEKLALVLDYLSRTSGETPGDAALLAHFSKQLAAQIAPWSETELPAALAALAVVSEIRERFPATSTEPTSPTFDALFQKAGDLPGLLRFVEKEETARCILRFIRKTRPDWLRLYTALMPGASPNVCDWIARELPEKERASCLRAVASAILASPDRWAGGLIWLWKSACTGKYADALAQIELGSLTVQLFVTADKLARTVAMGEARHAQLLSQMRSTIATKEFALLRHVLESTGHEQATGIRAVVERNAALSDHAIFRIIELLKQTHPTAGTRPVPPWEEDVIYTTAEGLRKRHAEYSHLVDVEMVKNSEAIGKAAALGDVTENAEYTGRLQEREVLTAKAARMQAELAKARAIPAIPPGCETVTVGCTVDVRDVSTGQLRTLTFLGPWDADPDKGIYCYNTAFGLAFMGKAKGDRVTFRADDREHTWEILDIRPGV